MSILSSAKTKWRRSIQEHKDSKPEFDLLAQTIDREEAKKFLELIYDWAGDGKMKIDTLKPDMISAPIKTEVGYYLVKITPLDKEIIQADVAVRERLRQELLNEKRRKRFDGVIADIRAKAVIRLADASRYVTDDVRAR